MASNQQNNINNISKQQQQQQQQQHEATITISPQEAQSYRATAQQNSIDAIRSAEERYAAAKDSGSTAFQHTKNAVVHGVCAGTDYVTGKGYQAADFTAEKGSQGYEVAREAAVVAARKTAEVAKQAAVKARDVAVGAGQTALSYASGKSGETGDNDKENVLIDEEEGRGGRKNVAKEGL